MSLLIYERTPSKAKPPWPDRVVRVCAAACVDVGTQTPSCPPHMAVSFRVDPNGIMLTHQMARARASMPPVPLLLLLDEPNAAIDAPTEALCKRCGEATQHSETSDAMTVVVAHWCSAVGMAARIVMVDKGRVLEAGSPEALMPLQDLSAARCARQAHTSR